MTTMDVKNMDFRAKANEHSARAKIWAEAQTFANGIQTLLDKASPGLATGAVRSHMEAAIKAVYEAADTFNPHRDHDAQHISVGTIEASEDEHVRLR